MLHFITPRFAFLLLILTLFDMGFNEVLQWRGSSPIFLYLLVCYAAFEWSSKKTLWCAFVVGVLRDALSGSFLGVETFSLVFCTAILDFIVHKIEREFPGIYFLLTVGFVSAVLFIQYFFTLIFGWVDFLSVGYGALLIFKVSLYTALFLSLVY